MPIFSLTPTVKASKAKNYSESTSKYNIIIPNIEGTVFINLQGEYKVVIDKDEYNIASECYSCKGVAEIYEQRLTNDLVRTRHIRSDRDRDDRDRTMYLPFTAGCSVKGNVVRHKAAGVIIFKIKKVHVDVDCPIAKQAIKYYRDNYSVIKKAISSNWIDNHVAEADQEVLDDVLNTSEND